MKGSLVECVERLHAAGYVVLCSRNAEQAAALLGTIAFEDGPVDAAMRYHAESVLASFPESFAWDAGSQEGTI